MRRYLPHILVLLFAAALSLLAMEAPSRGALWVALGPIAALGGLWFLRRTELTSQETSLSRQQLESEVFDRASAERRLHLFRSVVDSAAEMIYVMKPVEGRVVYANDSIARETGYDLPAVLNVAFSNLVFDLQATQSAADWKQWLMNAEGKKLAPQQGFHRRRDGSVFPIAIRASLIEHEEQGFVVAIVEDITERKQREEELVRTRDELTKLSRMDGLLGIANRRRFDEAFAREWHRAARQGAFLSLVLADIDHFKDYNDHYGHPAGDLCLQEVAQVFTRSIFRPADLVARYGGEELAVLLPETEAIGAKLVAEDLRAGVQALEIVHEGSAAAPTVTISLGVGTIRPLPSMPANEFLESVDKALYLAKENGRNRVEQDSGSRQANRRRQGPQRPSAKKVLRKPTPKAEPKKGPAESQPKQPTALGG